MKRTLWWVLGAFAAWQAADLLSRRGERGRLYSGALAAARAVGKPLLIVGLPQGDPYGCGQPENGDVVLDLQSTLKECRNHVQGSVEDLSRWGDHYFGAAFVSHVLEHTCDIHAAFRELHRVADQVVILFPPWWSLSAWVVPGHTWVLRQGSDGALRATRIRQGCNRPGYFGRV